MIIKTASNGNGQSNFTSNGRYYVRVKSTAGSSAMVPIHLVNYEKPELKLSETPVSGKNLHFTIENFVYGIENPVERVTLKNPLGEVEDLASIDDQYLISSDCFVLYNDNENHLRYKGNYEITIYANGFQAFSKTFRVNEGETPAAVHVAAAAYNSVDGISMATGGSSGGSSSGDSSGSLAISANLIFDSDLLVNARLLEKLDMETTESKAVTEWWYNVIDDAVFDEGDEYYDWIDYINAVEDQKAREGRMLPFAEYQEEGEIYRNHPATAKEVLEDGLLGEIQQNGNFTRLSAPELTILQNAEGSEVVLGCEDADYLNEVQSITINGNSLNLDSSKWQKDAEKQIITISSDVFTAGKEYKLTIDAEGYKVNYVTFTYSANTEDTSKLALLVQYPDGKQAFEAAKTEKEDVYYADAIFEITGTEGDFLTRSLTVTLDETTNVVADQTYYGSTSPYYDLDTENNRLILHRIKPGEHTISIRAQYYPGFELKADFTVVQEETPAEEVKEAPDVAGLEKKSEYVFFEGDIEYYRMTFDGMTGEEKKAYLKAITDVTVNGVSCKVGAGTIGSSESNTCKIHATVTAYDAYAYDVLDFTKDCLSDGAVIVIQAEGYEDLEYLVDLNSDLVVTKQMPPEVIGFEKMSDSYSSVGYYYASKNLRMEV